MYIASIPETPSLNSEFNITKLQSDGGKMPPRWVNYSLSFIITSVIYMGNLQKIDRGLEKIRDAKELIGLERF